MSFFSFRKKESSLSLVFDIRDTSITVAVAKFYFDNKPEIFSCQNFKINFSKPINYDKYISVLLKTMEDSVVSVTRDLVKVGNKERISNYYMFFGSPWCISQSKVIRIEKDRPFLIDEKLLRQVLSKEEENLIQRIDSSSEEKNWMVMEEKIIQLKLNGYKVNKIYDRKAEKVEMEFLVSFIPKEIQDKINEPLRSKIKENSNSTILSSFSFLRDLFLDKNDFIYFDINESITDLYIVRGDVLEGVSSFPIGQSDIIKEISAKSNLSIDIITSKINIKYQGNCDEKTSDEVDSLIENGFKLWFENFNSTISKMSSPINLPNNIFVVANSSISKIFAEKMVKDSLDKKIELLNMKINTEIIREEVFHNIITNAKVYMNEPYIKMDLVFLDKLLREIKK
jgi:hypothetical protein